MKITLAAARVNRGLTQKELAQMLGISNKTLCSWEKAKAILCNSASAFRKILGIPTKTLILCPAFRLKRKTKEGGLR